MTPLEMALQKEKALTCKTCLKAKQVGKILYCGASGKIILPRFYGTSLCHGERLKMEQNGKDRKDSNTNG